MSNTSKLGRDDYRHFSTIPTRWMDNDVYGHVNNVVYYSYFDTVVNKFLIDQGQLDFINGHVLGLVVETKCEYFAPITFPDLVVAGLRVVHLGTSSVKYSIGLFKNEEVDPSAQGHFIHVYVNRSDNRPTPLGDRMRETLMSIC